MKKLMFLGGVALLATSAMAQSFGVRAGYNLATFADSQYSPISGFHVGVVADLPISENLSIKPGLYYTMKGCTYETSILKIDVDADFRVNYIELPVLAAYKFVIDDQLSCQIQAGPYFAYGISGKSEGNMNTGISGLDYNSGKIDSFGDDAPFKRFDWGLSIGGEMEFNHFVFGVSYQFGLYNFAENKDSDAKNRVFTASVGYNF